MSADTPSEGSSRNFLTPASPPVPPPPKKISRERLDFVEGLYLAGRPRRYIANQVSERWGVTPRTGRTYIAIVEKRLAALPKPPPEATFQRVEAMLLETYDLAKNGVQRIVVSGGRGEPSQVEEYPQANVGVMATVAQRLADLHGVGGPQKVDVTSGGEKLAGLTIYAPPEKEP